MTLGVCIVVTTKAQVADSGDCGLCTELSTTMLWCRSTEYWGDAFMVVYNEAVLSGPCSRVDLSITCSDCMWLIGL